MILCNFQHLRPPFETEQEETLNWLVEAHVQSELQKTNQDPNFSKAALKEKLWQVGCKPTHIAKRGHIIADYLHTEWNRMDLYQLNPASPCGKDLSTRSSLYDQYVSAIFEEYYPPSSLAPDDLIHVSCTGYVSPSGAQKIVSQRNWGHQTTVTHAYHMGCYAAIPAIRMATGFLAADLKKSRIDIVHTELCSLHTNPSNHRPDQLVSQSLFADGFIKYSLLRQSDAPHYQIKATLEEIIPNSQDAMTWSVVHWGFEMTLDKKVPVLISQALLGFLERLIAKTPFSFHEMISKALFAIHPGGPKILKYIQDLLKLSDEQIFHSVHILKNYGNMSSATIPHIWQAILDDPNVPNHTPIISLAFGPGLSITSTIIRKTCGS